MSYTNNDWIPEEFEEVRSLGSGGFATVFIVRHKKLGYIRALKVLEETIEDEEDEIWKKFIKECRTLLIIGNGSLPNIVRVYHPRLVNHRAVVEMDYVKGQTVQSYIHEKKFIPYKEFVKFAEQIVGAVAYCHVDIYRDACDPVEDGLELDPLDGTKYKELSEEKKNRLIEKYEVVHNDLHSGNIIRREYDGQYILIDFGLSLNSSHEIKTTSRFSGAIEYCSPEKLLRKDISARSDVYSLGVLLYQVLTGQVPYIHPRRNCEIYDSDRRKECLRRQDEAPATIYSLRKKKFEKVFPEKEYTRDYPERLDEIIMKCIAYDANDRYENAKELLHDLRDVFENGEITESRPMQNGYYENAIDYKTDSDIESEIAPDTPVESVEQVAPVAETEISGAAKEEVSDAGKGRSNRWRIIFAVVILAALVMIVLRNYNSEAPDAVPAEDSSMVSQPKDTTAQANGMGSPTSVQTTISDENSEIVQDENRNVMANQESASAGKPGSSESVKSSGSGSGNNGHSVKQPGSVRNPITKPSHQPNQPHQPDHTETPTKGSISLGYGTWTGGTKNGKPDGRGRIVFHSAHKVDRHTSVVANPGDYFIATYERGQLVSGKLYDSSGKLLKTIIP